MKTLILSLVYLISVASAGVLDNLGELSEDRLLPDDNVGRIVPSGSQRLSQMEHNDLVRQKFLLDILLHVNEPSVSKELQQITATQCDKLVGDRNLYIGDFDEQMSHVVELSANQQLLGKTEVFIIANDEHMRQMNGLYRLLVRSRDWDTLHRNILCARIHVNGVLLVNSLLLAIRDRDDTQNLIMPGIHEILPELYLEEDLIRRAQDIDLNQFTTSRDNNMDTQRLGILEMIGVNKLLNRNTNALDRRQLWMPWRDMRMEMQSRRIAGLNAPMHFRVRDDNRIVLPAAQSSDRKDALLLTADVGFQSFMQSFVNDLCINENDVKQQNREQKVMESNKSNLARVALERNVVSIQRKPARGGSAEETQSVNIDIEKDLQSQRAAANRNIEVVGSNKPSTRFINREQVADEWRVNLQRNVLDANTGDSTRRGLGVSDRIFRALLPTTTADDHRLLYVNRKRQRAASINVNNLRGPRPIISWRQEEDDQGNNLHHARLGVRTNPTNIGNRRLSPSMDSSTGMPMDWNRQMALHRLQMNPFENKGRIAMSRVNNNANLGGHKWNEKLPEVDVDDERLLHVSRRKLSQLKRDEQQRQSEGINTQLWGSDKLSGNELRSTRRNIGVDNERQAEDSRNWPTFSHGLGYSGVNFGHNEIQNNENERGTKNMDRRRIINWDNERELSMQDADSSNMWHRRFPRSLTSASVQDRQRNFKQKRAGELLLHNLQQLLARINLELISLGLYDDFQLQGIINPLRFNNPRLTNAVGEGLALHLKDMHQNSRRNSMLLDRIAEIEKRLYESIEQEVIHSKHMADDHYQGGLDRLIGDTLLGEGGSHQDVSILNVLREIILQDEDIQGGVQKLTYITMNVADPIVLHLLHRILRIADLQRQQQLGSYRKEEIEMSGLTINEVRVDKLRTFIDTSDVDLINALNARQPLNENRDADQAQPVVIARQLRLNHKKFTINMDVSSDRDQRVIVRTLLGPKIVDTEHEVPLNDQRKNFMLLDANIVDLHKGRNQIKRKSRDINWTSRDTTSFSEIYKRVMLALNGKLDITLDQVQGQNCRFPHRLLLPRGRTEGLPMQMLVVITPVEDDARTMQELVVNSRVCGMGMGGVNVDRLPLGFPLDRPIDENENILLLPNLHMVDVQIYHDH